MQPGKSWSFSRYLTLPNVFAVDTSGEIPFIALAAGAAVSFNELAARKSRSSGLSEVTLPFLAECGLIPGDLTHLAVSIGPGKFIRTRVGISFVNGLAAGLGIPVIPIDSLGVLAQAAKGKEERIGAIRRAKKDHVVCAAGLETKSGGVYFGENAWQFGPSQIPAAEFLESEIFGSYIWAVETNCPELKDLSTIDRIKLSEISTEDSANSILQIAQNAIGSGRFSEFAGQSFALAK